MWKIKYDQYFCKKKKGLRIFCLSLVQPCSTNGKPKPGNNDFPRPTTAFMAGMEFKPRPSKTPSFRLFPKCYFLRHVCCLTCGTPQPIHNDVVIDLIRTWLWKNLPYPFYSKSTTVKMSSKLDTGHMFCQPQTNNNTYSSNVLSAGLLYQENNVPV